MFYEVREVQKRSMNNASRARQNEEYFHGSLSERRGQDRRGGGINERTHPGWRSPQIQNQFGALGLQGERPEEDCHM